MLKQIAAYIRTHGILHTLRRAGEKAAERVFHLEHRRWLALRPTDAELARQRAQQPGSVLISVVVPVYNTDPAMLLAMAASLHAQTYAAWEAVLYDGASDKPETLDALAQAAALDDRIRVIHGTANAGISGNTNAAVALARGAYCALCDHDDLLTPDALWSMADAIRRTGADMLYSDEDKVTEDGRWHTDLHLKPDFGPDTLRSGNYICHLMVLSAELLRRVGGLRPAFDGSQDHDLALRCSEQARQIVHIPRILYHWRTVGASMSHQKLQVCMDAACRAVAEQMTRIGCPGSAVMERGVIRLCYTLPQALTVRVLMLHAPADAPASPLPPAFCRQGVAVQPVPRADTRALNDAALNAPEDLLLFWDADAVTPIQDDFIDELAMYAQRSDVGAVCPMLLLPGRPARIAAAGMTVTSEGCVLPRHAHRIWAGGGYRAQALTSHNISVVPPACFMIRRDHFLPFDAPPAPASVAGWCLQLSQRGLRHVYTPHAAAVLRSGRAAWLTKKTGPLLPAGFRDPCISPHHTAAFVLRKGAKNHAAD